MAGHGGVPAQIVFTKVDKLSASERGLLRERARALFGGGGGAGPLLVSGETGEGLPELWAAIFERRGVGRPPPNLRRGAERA